MGDRETGRQGDRETGRQGDRERERDGGRVALLILARGQCRGAHGPLSSVLPPSPLPAIASGAQIKD